MSQGRRGDQPMFETEPGHITGQSHQKYNVLIEEMTVPVLTTGHSRNLLYCVL
jgi:hypothetical protein